MVDVVQCDNKSLPVTIDVPITVSKAQISQTIDLTKVAFVTPETPLADIFTNTGAGRIRYYITLNSVIDDFGTAGEVFKAAATFFSQTPRTQTMAVATAFDTPQNGFLKTGTVGAISTLNAISDASFKITIDGDTQEITGIDLTSLADYDAIAGSIKTEINAIATGGYTLADVIPSASTGTDVVFYITSGTAGDGSTIGFLEITDPLVGTDISGPGFLNGRLGAGVLSIGYTPTGLANELALISEAASCASGFVYGYVLDDVYRDTQSQLDASAWAEGQFFAILGVESTNPLTVDPSDTTSNFFLSHQADYRRTIGFYADESQLNEDESDFYHSMSSLALMLSVNYAGENTVKNLKFKNLPTIPPTPISIGDLTVVLSKRANVFTTVGTGSRVVQAGSTFSDSWWVDQTINIDNFINDLTTAVYNVFLVNGVVPYNNVGEALFRQAEGNVCERYVRNGTLSDQTIRDSTSPTGFRTIPAYEIVFPNLADIPIADRAARILNGNQIILQLAGAINKLTIDVIVQE